MSTEFSAIPFGGYAKEVHRAASSTAICRGMSRIVLEQRARQHGCSLMLDPDLDVAKMGERGSTLWEFLESMPDDKVQVVIRRPRVRLSFGRLSNLAELSMIEFEADSHDLSEFKTNGESLCNQSPLDYQRLEP